MDPQLDKTPGLALPQVSAEQRNQPYGNYQAGDRPAEVLPQQPEAVGAMAPQQSAVPLPAMPMPQQPTPAMQLPQNDASQATAVPAAAGDESDALDEEWVNKAKAIVAQTKTDPYIESRELGKAKADYLRIRFNKQIKVVEDQK